MNRASFKLSWKPSISIKPISALILNPEFWKVKEALVFGPSYWKEIILDWNQSLCGFG